MAHITADRVRDTTTTTGTGAITVSGTAPSYGYRTFSALCSTNDTFFYCIAHQSAEEWETGRGTYTASNTITRSAVIASSNSNNAVNFSAGVKDVFITLAAGKTVQLNNSGNIVIPGTTSGNLTIAPPAAAGTATVTFPATTGTLVTTGDSATVTPTMLSQPLTRATSVASTSGTAIDFTSIPSWVRRITVMLNGVSHSSATTNEIFVRLGTSGGLVTSGYTSGGSYTGTATAGNNPTAGFGTGGILGSTNILHGIMSICNVTSNTWTASFSGALSDSAYAYMSGGSIALAGTLDRLSILTSNGATFDAGNVNILYEG